MKEGKFVGYGRGPEDSEWNENGKRKEAEWDMEETWEETTCR